jgi:pilus assembly protein CpaE
VFVAAENACIPRKTCKMPDNPDSTSNFLFVALFVPDAERRRTLAAAVAGSRNAIVRDFGDQPMPADLSGVARTGCDVAIVDLDGDPEQAARVIESICGQNPSTTVMAYSGKSDLALARRAMQAGARDFLSEPFLAETVKDAFSRIASRRTFQRKAPGKLLVFAPGKAGVGVTSVATNFAIALKRESGARVVIVDMDLQLGDVALGLGVKATCSVADALRNPSRLDRDFLSNLLVRHKSGLDVLSAPDEFSSYTFKSDEGADKLFEVLGEEFDYVVVDSGTCGGRVQQSLFEKADKLYLVLELSFPALRNANRMISHLTGRDGIRNLEVVLNKFDSPAGDIDEARAIKAIGRPIDWRIPDGRQAAWKARDTGVPLAMEKSPVPVALAQMAKAACGKPLGEEKSSGLLHFFDFRAMMQFSASGR